MRTVIMIAVLISALLVPALAADAPAATDKRVTNLENATQVIREDLGNTKLELDTTKENLQKSINDEANARQDLEKRLAALTKLLEDEMKARGETDKLVAELQTEMANKQMAIDGLKDQLAQEKADREVAAANLAKALATNAKKDKKDQTINYGLAFLLAGLTLSK